MSAFKKLTPDKLADRARDLARDLFEACEELLARSKVGDCAGLACAEYARDIAGWIIPLELFYSGLDRMRPYTAGREKELRELREELGLSVAR